MLKNDIWKMENKKQLRPIKNGCFKNKKSPTRSPLRVGLL